MSAILDKLGEELAADPTTVLFEDLSVDLQAEIVRSCPAVTVREGLGAIIEYYEGS